MSHATKASFQNRGNEDIFRQLKEGNFSLVKHTKKYVQKILLMEGQA
jgi:hypothetical protein